MYKQMEAVSVNRTGIPCRDSQVSPRVYKKAGVLLLFAVRQLFLLKDSKSHHRRRHHQLQLQGSHLPKQV